MSYRPINIVNVIPGNFCNLRCNHCVNDSGPNRSDKLETSEVESIVHELNKLMPKLVLFTGGEPTLHMNLINEIISRLSYPSFEIQITTNGWFAKSEEKLARILDGFEKLDRVQLSYDSFHGSSLNQDDVRRLARACATRNLRFNVTICVSDSLDIIKANQLSNDLGLEINYQKVAAVGRARSNGVEFKQPRFDYSILEQRCPSIDTLSYVHGKGFTFCCGPLVFESDAPIAHETIESHMKSEIRQKFGGKTFGQLFHEAGGKENELTPAMSHPCVLCHHIQRRGRCAKGS